MAERPQPPNPSDATRLESQKGAHGGGNRFFQMTIKDAFEIQKRNQQANIKQQISTPKNS